VEIAKRGTAVSVTEGINHQSRLSLLLLLLVTFGLS
jgi:hypothetical protein